MNEDSFSVGDNGNQLGTKAGVSTSLPITDPANQSKVESGPGPRDYWEILLGELIHLLGLFFVHSKHARGVRTTEVLFDQLMRHLGIINKMPDNDGGILIRKSYSKAPLPQDETDYLAMCGKLMISAKGESGSKSSQAAKRFAHLESALIQAFQSLLDMGIHSLYLKIPENTEKRIDQFRLALNIAARFQASVNEGSSIRFRCYGRALTFPLINDTRGHPDPNLTLTAALNGLSPVNARELIKQAEAFHKLNNGQDHESESSMRVSSYNQIFSVRSLRSQLVKPPIEINNIPWMQIESSPLKKTNGQPCGREIGEKPAAEPTPAMEPKGIPTAVTASSDSNKAYSPESIRQLLTQYIDKDDHQNHSAIEALLAGDYGELEPFTIGKRFVSITQLLYVLDKCCQDQTVFERIIAFFHHRLKTVPDSVLSNIIVQRQGLKIVGDRRSVMVGMVHPRLFDLITLVSEHVAAQRRMAIIEEMAFNFDPCHIPLLADGFGISTKDAHLILEVLKDCFSASGRFVRPTFEGRIGQMAQFENAIFEMLWCFLKQTPRRQDRLNFLNALQLLMERLNSPKRATQFLLADICQLPSDVRFTDRNAFSLTNILLHQENKELYVDINRTPEDVLNLDRRINTEVKRYLVWRLEADKVRMLSKLRTIHQRLQQTLLVPNETDGAFEAAFLWALEREALIFLAIVGGHTARIFLREAFNSYGRTDSAFYQREAAIKDLSDAMAQLQILIRALGRAGNIEDIELLKALSKQEKALCNLNPHPANTLRVKQVMKWIPKAIKTIHT
ncbi:MAG: hypothetical protein PVH87_18085 [Desulfobacteraceae bacterium]|jgi:hypothetical protein